MKKIIGLLVIFSTLSALASSVKTLKVFDGATAYCHNAEDVVRLRHGVYTAEAVAVSLNNNESKISVKTKLNFYRCTGKGSSIGFQSASPKITVNQKVDDNSVSIHTSKVKFLAYQDGVYKILAEEQLGSASSQFVTLQLDVADLMDNEGSPLNVRRGNLNGNIDLIIQKEITVQGGDIAPYKDLLSYGAFRVHFEINNGKAHLLK